MSIYTHKQMDGLTAEEQAKKAILATLQRIRNHEYAGYYMGFGSQTFDLLTEAYATLTGGNVEQIRRTYACPNPRSAEHES